jgi:EmrB/QacA subfamily drug resistance transporter
MTSRDGHRAADENCAADQPLGRRDVRNIFYGLMLSMFLSALNQTIVATALPTIGRDFGDFDQLSWVIIAYLLSSTVVSPLYGKLSDIHGRRTMMLVALGLFIAGSAACALAPSLAVLIAGRTLQGIGGGGIVPLTQTTIADMITPRERGHYQAYMGTSWIVAGVAGPALGGIIAEYLHWSVIFWMNIPLGIIAVAMTFTLLRGLPRHDRPHKLDFLGAALIMAASSSFMLALSMGGVNYPWLSTPILALFAAALLLGAAFIVRLRTAPEPLIPLSILSNREVRLAIAANAFGWAPIVGLHIFLPMYLQNIVGLAPASAGLSVLTLAVTLNISAGITGTILPRRERYKTIPIAGLTLAIAAALMLAWRAKSMTLLEFEVLLFLIGTGFGCMPPLSATALQNNVSIHTFGSAVATMQFSRNLFATMLVAVFGAIILSGVSQTSGATTAPYSVEGFVHVFLAVAASFAVSLVAMFLLDEKPLETKHA